MTGELDLTELFSSMQPVLKDGLYCFVHWQSQDEPQALSPLMSFVEEEGLTLILSLDQAQQAGLHYAFPCRMITLDVHSSLEAVGFLAGITAGLKDAGISVNAVSAFFHDHLFVPVEKAELAMAVLQQIIRDSSHPSDNA